VDREKPPDPGFPRSRFLSYDEDPVRVTFWSIARFVRCQLCKSWDYYENAQEDGRSAEKRLAANMVLDIESFLGLDTNAEVLCTWLEAEKELFLPAGEIKEESYKKTLTEAKGLAERIRDPKEKQHARQVLFECWLAQLSLSGKRGLLSERIEKAEKWAGFETVKGKR
jgi:hypothetical protein